MNLNTVLSPEGIETANNKNDKIVDKISQNFAFLKQIK